jgi:hypothetical protein
LALTSYKKSKKNKKKGERIMKLSELKTGLQITCKIEGEEIESALLYVKRFKAWTHMHICQNLKGAANLRDNMGFKKAWVMSFDNDKPFKPEKWHVTDFKVVDEYVLDETFGQK